MPTRSEKPNKRNAAMLRQIRIIQESTHNLIPKLPFARVVREILNNNRGSYRITVQCLLALQEATELFLVQLLEDAYRCTAHRDRVTLMPKDIELVRYLRGVSDVANKQ